MRSTQFRLFWTGEAVSLVGTATTGVLLPLVAATQLEAGPGAMGLLTAASWLPWLLLGLPAGALVDQLPPRATMLVADLVAALAAASVPFLAAGDALTVPGLVTVAFVIGCCSVVFRGALPRLITRVVDPDELGAANSRLFATESASQIAGPGLAGGLAAAVTAAGGIVLDAVSFLVSAACLARLKPRAGADDGREPFLRRIRVGLRVVGSDPILRYFPFLALAANFGLTGLTTLQVLFLVDDVGAGDATIGVVLAIIGLGGVIGALLGPSIARRVGSARGDMLLQLASCSILLVPLATGGAGLGWMVAGLLVSETAIVASNVIRTTWRQRYVSQELLGRVSTINQTIAFAAMPVSALTAGWLGQQIGVRAAIGVMLSVHVAAVLTMPFSPVGRIRDLPERPAGSERRQPAPVAVGGGTVGGA
ncbi:MFS transporter [Nocardioides sp. CER19]|uniref:MFS transporter n=1 Tax=Nocardioides sp. CER19 TaxID=3038538 RepID=UPI00244BAE27|nr:MFS transporter [Nocardioides sp. CER19]MDH2415827.1 MFS transporter [Nocardioides sp. CER19]